MVNHISSDEWPEWIEIPGSTKRAGFKVRANADKPQASLQRARMMQELARQVTREYLGSGKGGTLPTLSDTEVPDD
ncbi:hypothetical protein [Methanorbis furvi]|uniref:hypothetical protein n=1 Tax=Methanorbis furvi TaxID=3028299 RepID=UPI0030B8FDC0